ncbi:calcyphosin [Angomonas deanei]|nr:calcyphosin [Angomonas deanei]|eukprot:EPY43883.1 calcyphosin [Angomonas deanei]
MVNELRGELNDRRTQLVKSTYKMLQSLSSEHILRLSDMARLVDLTYCPSVMAGDCSVEDALADFEDAWAARDPNMLIQESAFSAFYGDVSFEFPLDNDFERFMRNTWHLSGGSGNCANVSCRKVEVIHLDGRVTTEEIKNDLAIKGEGEEIQELLVKNLASQGIKDVKKISVIKP